MKLLGKQASKVWGLTSSLAFAGLTLYAIGLSYVWMHPEGNWPWPFLVLVPSLLLFLAYRAYATQREKSRTLEALFESTTLLERSLHLESVIKVVLAQARKMFRAEIAEVLLFSQGEDEPSYRSVLGPGEDEWNLMQEIKGGVHPDLWAPLIQGDPMLMQGFADTSIRAIAAPIKDDKGTVGMVLVASSVSGPTFDEQDLKLLVTLTNHASMTLQNARLVARLEDSLAHLTEMNRLKDDFVASVSHELRTPLTSIQGYVKTLLRADDRLDVTEHQSFLEGIDRQSERLRALIEDLLVVSRLEAQHSQDTTVTFSVPWLAQQVIDELGSRARRRKIELRFPDRFPIVHNDQGKVHQILSNLVDNALKYAPNGPIEVFGEVEGEGVVISVRDHGEGIPLDEQERIFDRFYQVDQSSTRAVGGTGLGLYICRKMAEAVGGRIWLERSSSKGSTFSLWLPTSAPNVTPTDPTTAIA